MGGGDGSDLGVVDGFWVVDDLFLTVFRGIGGWMSTNVPVYVSGQEKVKNIRW